MSKLYPEPDGKSYAQREEGILSSWEERGVLRRLKERMKGGEPLVFCEGPPTANNRPHIGNALTRVVKDAFLRYHVMNGRKIVPFIGGWDCHGLPVELEVERSLGLKNKADIERFGVDKFNRLCRESVLRYKADWERMSRRVGYWIDFENAYMTMSNDYIESVWWSLKQLHSKGMLYKAQKVVPYCPRCGTTLSNHEVALGFKETEGRFAIAKVKVEGLDASLLVWTNAPWTLVANALVAVDKDQEYVVFERSGQRYVLSADRTEWLVGTDKVVRQVRGSELVGKKYEPPFSYHDYRNDAHRIVHSHEVPKEEGTGAIPLSPAYGTMDYEMGTKNSIEIFDPVDDMGRFTNDVPELSGKLVIDSDPEIIRMLESKGALFRWGLLKHAYPFCWRCDTALIYRAMDAWHVKTTDAKRRLVSLNHEIRWVPEAFKEGRFGKFLADVKDWAVSRSRYWGTPLPLWRCERGHEHCIGSAEDLRIATGGSSKASLDLHIPEIDSLALKCPECGSSMKREPFVIDCWYDSGCAPFAQYHYPFENIEKFDTHRSVDFIAESVDQTRGWFYTQHVLGTLLFDKPAFRSVLVLGQVVDEKGHRISPESGNVVFTEDVFAEVGADATRLFFLSNSVSEPVEFSREGVREAMTGAVNTLVNAYAFFASNANAYSFQPQQTYMPTHDLDRWIVSRLHSATRDARAGFDKLEIHESVRALTAFIGDLSNWYIRRSRRRFWEESDPLDRFSAHCTLHECLLTVSKLMAPITPFLADWLYSNLKGPRESVHLEDYPQSDDNLINGTLERQMKLVITAVEAGRLARQKVNVKLRQPLTEAVIATDSNKAWSLRRYEKMISEELNVKKVEVLESREKMIQYAVSANLRTLGPKLKDAAPEVARLISKMDENELVKHLRSSDKIRLGGFDLSEEDVVITEKDKIGFSHADVGDVHVYVALEVTANLRLEGLAREVIRRIQHMRKEQRLDFETPVRVEYSGHPDLEKAILAHSAHIKIETHATSVQKSEHLVDAQKWVVNKMALELKITSA